MRKLYVKILLGCLGCFGGGVMGQATLPLTRTAWGTPPTGWTDNGIHRTSNFACTGNDGGSMQSNGKNYLVFFNSTPDKLNYTLKGTNPTTGDFRVQESADGLSWTDVQSFTSIAGSTCLPQSNIQLLSTTRYVKFILVLKTTGNVDIDDVVISKSSGFTKYWDANGAAAGVGGSAVWGTTFNDIAAGTNATTTAAATDNIIYQGTVGTVTLSGNQTVANHTFNVNNYIIVSSATSTLAGNMSLGTYNLNLSPSTSTILTIPGIVSGTGSLNLNGAGTTIFSGNNTYTGITTITTGTLALGAANRIANASNLIFNGGTFNTAGFGETVGTLGLSESSTIALGAANHSLSFSNSNAVVWTGGKTLTITGWTGTAGTSGTAGKIFIGSAATHLISTQLSQIRFTGFTGNPILLSTGELVPPGAPPLWTNSITGTDPGLVSPYTTGDVTNSDITVSGISRGLGISGNAADNRYNANGWSTSTLDLNDYFYFTLTPNLGKVINFADFTYTGQKSSSGPTNFELRSSLDDFTSNIGMVTEAGTSVDLSGSTFQNIFCPITFKFYAWSGTGGTYSINDFTFNGTVANVGPLALTISNSGTPPAGNLFLSSINNIFSCFDIAANTSQTFSAVTIKHTGTATTADVNNIRIFWDQNANGIIDGADAIVPGATVASLAASMGFTFSTGQTFSCKRKYLVVGDVLPGATLGGTVITSVTASSDVTSTIPTSGNAIGNTQTIAFKSLSSDYFRSNVASGSWANAASWESSHDNTTFYTASLAPTKSATSIIIRNGHNINISTSGVSMTNTTVQNAGILQITTTSSFELSGAGSGRNIQLIIKNGGAFLVNCATSYASPTGDAFGLVETGGKVIAGPLMGSITSTGTGSNFSDAYLGRNNGLFYFGNDAICEWQCPFTTLGSATPIDSDFFFPDNTSDMPVFRIVTSPPFEFGSNSINNKFFGVLEVVSPAIFLIGKGGSSGTAGTKTFLGGIRGTGTVTQNATPDATDAGNIILGDGTNVPVMDGSITLNIQSNKLKLPNGALVPFGASFIIASGAENNSFHRQGGNLTINGKLDITNMKITNTATGAVIVNDTLRTSNSGGLYGAGSAIVSGGLSINSGSTIDYYATVNQAITNPSIAGISGTSTVTETLPTPGNFQAYYNIIFSGSGTKTPANYTRVHSNGSVNITGSPVVDFSTNNLGTTLITNTTKFTMDGGLLILGTSPGTGLPLMRGDYNLTGGILRYTNTGAQTIRATTPTATLGKYQNIEITGTNVSNSGNVNLNKGGTFTVADGGIYYMRDNSITGDNISGQETVTVKTGGRFKTENGQGFHGFSATLTENSSIHSNVENIVLEPGSIVEYSRDIVTSIIGDQEISNALTSNYPTAFVYQNLIISGSGKKTAPANNLTIAGKLTKTSTSIFKHNGGTVLFNGTLGQIFSNSSGFAMTFNNVTNNSTGQGLVIKSDSMAIVRKLFLGSLSKLILDDGNIILKSSDTATANVAAIPDEANIISYSLLGGRFITERYIEYTGNWNLLTAPVAESGAQQSIKDSWQEGALNKNGTGYGTQVTMPPPIGTGLDDQSLGYSIKWWNPVTNAFEGVNNTVATYANQPSGFFAFVRGDRSIGPGNTGDPTILRSRGKLYIGNSGSLIEPPGVNYVSFPANTNYSAGNPFASTIKFQNVYNNSTNLKDVFYLWDPTQWGGYSVGAYQAFSGTTSWLPTPSPGLGLYVGTAGYDSIQSGQAFYIESNLFGNTAIVFKEDAKINGSRTVTRGGGPEILIMMSTMLHNAAGIVADGNRVVFDNAYSKSFAKEDARKITNGGENFGLSVDSYTAIVEGRPEIVETDTIFYKMSNLQTKNYILSFEPRNLNSTGLQAFLIDNFLNNRTAISLTDSTYYNFAATSAAASKATNRFMLVFKAAGGPLPVTLTQILAKRNNDQTITVTWKVEQEQQLSHYEVERSADGLQFTKLATVPATNANEYAQLDVQPLLADNYYRIKAVSQNGLVQYSRIVKVGPLQLFSKFGIYPNPVQKHQLQMQLITAIEGSYKLQLYNTGGQLVFEKSLIIKSGTQNITIPLPKYLSSGNYRLSMQEAGGGSLSENILLQ